MGRNQRSLGEGIFRYEAIWAEPFCVFLTNAKWLVHLDQSASIFALCRSRSNETVRFFVCFDEAGFGEKLWRALRASGQRQPVSAVEFRGGDARRVPAEAILLLG